MKRLLNVFILGMIFISLGANLVSAGSVENVQTGVTNIYKMVEPVLSYIVGGTGSSAEFFLAKVLFLIIIFTVVWVALSNLELVKEKDWVLWVISISVSILAVRWFGNVGVVRSIILPYSVLGITITAALPFFLYFLIVEKFAKTFRKIAWLFFMIVFIGLWIMRSGEEAIGGQIGNFAYIYLVTAGIALLVMMFDGTIQRIMAQSEVEKTSAVSAGKMAVDLREEIEKLTKRFGEEKDNYVSVYSSRMTGHKGWRKDMNTIQKNIAALKS